MIKVNRMFLNNTYQQKHVKRILTFLILFVIWLVPSNTPSRPTPTLALVSGGEPVAGASAAAVHKRPAFPWARVEVPQQNIFWAGPLWHRLQAAVNCRTCEGGVIITTTSFPLDYIFDALIMKDVKITQEATRGQNTVRRYSSIFVFV